MEKIVTNPSVRIRPPSAGNDGSWSVELLKKHTLWKVPEVAVQALILARRPAMRQEIVSLLAGRMKLSEGSLAALIEFLAGKGLLIALKPGNGEGGVLSPEFWQAAAAAEAGDYFMATFDYPFLDYSETGDGYLVQRAKMFTYAAESPDNCRYKDGYKFTEEILLPNPREARVTRAASFRTNLAAIASLAFMRTGTKAVPWTPDPLIRRTSPSGGSRHPTEGYLILKGDVYHASTKTNSLRMIGRSDCFRPVSSDEDAIFVLTCVFERNSFRYREPRTFRTVHMDAGHILGTVELLSFKAGCSYRSLLVGDIPAVHEALGIDGVSEFFVSACVLGAGGRV